MSLSYLMHAARCAAHVSSSNMRNSSFILGRRGVICLIFDVKWLSSLVRNHSLQVSNFNSNNDKLLALPGPSTSSFKSIEGYAGEVSVHRIACHFNSLHFTGQAPGESEQDACHPSSGQSPLYVQSSKRAHLCRKSVMIEEKIKEAGWVRLAVPPSHPRQALTRLEGTPVGH